MECLKLWGCCLFWKIFFCKIVLLLNCRNNVYIPQFLRWNWYSTHSIAVSTLECDARIPRFKLWPPQYNFPTFLYFFSCFNTFDFKYIFFSFNLFFFLNIYKTNNKKKLSIVEHRCTGGEQPIRAKLVLSFRQNHLTGLARKSCMVVSACMHVPKLQFCRLNWKVISHGVFPRNQEKGCQI